MDVIKTNMDPILKKANDSDKVKIKKIKYLGKK